MYVSYNKYRDTVVSVCIVDGICVRDGMLHYRNASTDIQLGSYATIVSIVDCIVASSSQQNRLVAPHGSCIGAWCWVCWLLFFLLLTHDIHDRQCSGDVVCDSGHALRDKAKPL